jgi:L-ribulose-5-phosphate 4-epimerase
VVHTHSLHATAWAQARRPVPPLGTTHADYFHGPVPCTRPLSRSEVEGDYEANTGKVIVETFEKLDPLAIPAVLVGEHGPFAWGRSAASAVDAAVLLEHIAELASRTVAIRADVASIGPHLLDKHFLRKHGPGAYYGQE